MKEANAFTRDSQLRKAWNDTHMRWCDADVGTWRDLLSPIMGHSASEVLDPALYGTRTFTWRELDDVIYLRRWLMKDPKVSVQVLALMLEYASSVHSTPGIERAAVVQEVWLSPTRTSYLNEEGTLCHERMSIDTRRPLPESLRRTGKYPVTTGERLSYKIVQSREGQPFGRDNYMLVEQDRIACFTDPSHLDYAAYLSSTDAHDVWMREACSRVKAETQAVTLGVEPLSQRDSRGFYRTSATKPKPIIDTLPRFQGDWIPELGPNPYTPLMEARKLALSAWGTDQMIGDTLVLPALNVLALTVRGPKV